MADRDDAETFADPKTQRTKTVGSAAGMVACGFLAFQISHGITTFEISYLVIVLLAGLGCAVAFFRSLRVGITLDDHGVTVRSVTSTKSWRWEELRGARSRDRTSIGHAQGMLVPTRQFTDRVQIIPMLDLTSGKTVQLYGLRIQVAFEESINWVDEAIAEINHRLEQRRKGPGAATPS